MRAIILAAGEGKRLGALTAEQPKCMVPYKGKPLVDHQVETLRACGIEDIVIVRGYRGEKIMRDDVTFVDNPRYEKTNMVYSLFCAEFFLSGDILISYGDIVYSPQVLRAVLKAPFDLCVAVDVKWRELWQKRMEDPLKDAETMKIDADGTITELGKKPRTYEDIQGQYIGLIKISASVIEKAKDFYRRLPRDERYDGQDFDNMYMTSFIQKIADELTSVYAVRIKGGWVEIDRISDLAVDFVR